MAEQLGTPEGEIEPDVFDANDNTDGDSAIGSMYAESIGGRSIDPNHVRRVEVYGRLYALFGSKEYWMPMDEQELDRIDISHAKLLILLDQKLFLAPISPYSQRILDLGTGTGIWAIYVADEYPSAEVIGVDIAPYQPQWVPPNCKFELDDIDLDWTWKKSSFDFIHARSLLLCVKDWPRLAKQCYEHLKPGGYTEFQTVFPRLLCDDDSAPPDSGLMKWSTYVFRASELCGYPLSDHNQYRSHLASAGFVDIVEHRFKFPSSPWPKDQKLKLVGAFELANLTRGISGMSLRLFNRAFGWTQEETEIFLVDVKEACKNMNYHTYWEFVVCYGRKPFQEENKLVTSFSSPPPAPAEGQADEGS